MKESWAKPVASHAADVGGMANDFWFSVAVIGGGRLSLILIAVLLFAK